MDAASGIVKKRRKRPKFWSIPRDSGHRERASGAPKSGGRASFEAGRPGGDRKRFAGGSRRSLKIWLDATKTNPSKL
jgi:hypothetical protein